MINPVHIIKLKFLCDSELIQQIGDYLKAEHYNYNGNNTTRNWIIILNIINVKKEITQHYLNWDATLLLTNGYGNYSEWAVK